MIIGNVLNAEKAMQISITNAKIATTALYNAVVAIFTLIKPIFCS